MIVAVASDFLPPQHSPMLGHLASSHTVANFNSRTSFFTLWNDFPLGIGTFNQLGNLAFGSFLAVSNGSSNMSLAFPLTKSSNDGPLFNSSVKIVLLLFVFTRVDSVASVASVLIIVVGYSLLKSIEFLEIIFVGYWGVKKI